MNEEGDCFVEFHDVVVELYLDRRTKYANTNAKSMANNLD